MVDGRLDGNKPSTDETPPTGKINPSIKITVTFEPMMQIHKAAPSVL